jgi:hypothetical protein
MFYFSGWHTYWWLFWILEWVVILLYCLHSILIPKLQDCQAWFVPVKERHTGQGQRRGRVKK